jgi:hypothetical protein
MLACSNETVVPKDKPLLKFGFDLKGHNFFADGMGDL